MAEVTEELTAHYKEWSHAEMLQEIADLTECVKLAKAEAEVAEDDRLTAEEDANKAASEAEAAEYDRDKLEEQVGRLENEWRYARGMKLPTAGALANALADARGLSPHHISRLV
jgi:hypothetical protein